MGIRRLAGCKVYHVDIRDAGGKRHRVPAFESRAASELLENNLKILIDYGATSAPPPAEIIQWLRGLPSTMLDDLARRGLVPQVVASSGCGVGELIGAWAAGLLHHGDGAKHVDDSKERVRRFVESAKIRRTIDIDLARAERHIRHLEVSPRTINAHVQSLKAFSSWLHEKGHCAVDPLARLQRVSEKGRATVKRRALSPEDFERLLDAARAYPKPLWGTSGEEWALIFRTAAWTGFRWDELRGLTRSRFDLSPGQEAVTIEDSDSKNKTFSAIPIVCPDLVEDLRVHLRDKLPGAPAFRMPASDSGAKIVRRLMEAAGLAYIDPAGRRFDFHALRGQFGTSLCRAGVPVAVARELMRHANISTTIKHYAFIAGDDKRDAMKKAMDANAPKRDEGAADSAG